MTETDAFHEDFRRTQARPTGSDRSFGIVFAALFLVIAAWPLFGGEAPRWWSAGVAAAFLLVALVRPALLRPLNSAWMAFGHLLHRIVTPLIMGFLFFVVVTPMGWLMRRFGAQPIPLGFDARTKSYWIRREPPGPPPDSMNRQY